MLDYNDYLVAKTAWYYYVENMTQQQISEKLGISRMKVIKYLDEARETGVVQFKISKEHDQSLEIEKKLCEKYGLVDAFVVPTPTNPSKLNESLAHAAAFYINDHINNDTYINMGYGNTMSRVLNHLATITTHNISIVSLTGGVNYYLPNAESNIFKAKLYLYPSPLLLSNKEVASELRNEKCILAIQRMIQLSSLSVIGIGAMDDNATVIQNGILTKDDFTYLKMQGAVGDLLTHFIDEDGNPINSELEDRMISTSLQTLKELNNVIAIGGGQHKVVSIKAALKGQYFSTLITDEETALQLV